MNLKEKKTLMLIKRFAVVTAIISVLALLLSGCGGSSKKEKEFDPEKNLVYEKGFFDDFTNRDYSAKAWTVANQKWGSGYNNGVKASNVNYTKDGILVLQANGDYYAGELGENGKRSGAAIISNQVFGPGRFEVKMKVLPRFGATSAIWTFFYGDADGRKDLNQEIDIELNVGNDFTEVWNTSWHTTKSKATSKYNSHTINNDGEWHTYKIEWHTNPERIDYYIDEELTCSSSSMVPWCAGRLWIGCWFPDAWAGEPDFETDYMLVDYVRYIPYQNNPCTVTNPKIGAYGEYPSTPIELPVANLISNGDMEGDASAWIRTSDTKSCVLDGTGTGKSKGLAIPNADMAYQFVTGMYEGFEITLDFNAKLKEPGTEAYILVECRPLASTVIETIRIDILAEGEKTEDGFIKQSRTFVLPEGCKRLEVSLICQKGSVVFDDLYMSKSYKKG